MTSPTTKPRTFSKKVVVFNIIIVILFIAIGLFFNWHEKEIQNELLIGFFTFFSVESGILGVIKVKKSKTETPS